MKNLFKLQPADPDETLKGGGISEIAKSDEAQPALFTPRFFLLCSFTFTTFASAFLLFPTMPFRILALGGSKSQAGLFLGFLTYASAFSAPLGGAVADRVGKAAVLLISSAATFVFALVYAVTSSLWLILLLAIPHGFFWSALLSGSAALLTDIIPPLRRAEGIGYWGVANILAIALAPSLGLVVFNYGWVWVCVLIAVLAIGMFVIAYQISDRSAPHVWNLKGLFSGGLVERKIVALAGTLFLYSFGYGSITSYVALYAEESGVTPRGIYFMVFSGIVILTRPHFGRLADRVGTGRVLVPLLGLTAVGFGILAISGTLPYMVVSAVVFGIGFGSSYPVFAAYVLGKVDERRRGAAFGSILLALDTGIGSGSILLGIMIEKAGYRPAFALAAVMAACAIPYFLLVRRALFRS